MSRPSWDEYFMNIAGVVSSRATCDRASVGCVITKDNRIISTGYNASIPGKPHCDDVGHLLINHSCVRAVHAEENAIANAAKYGVSLLGATAYITHFPCWKCFRNMINAGIQRIVFLTPKANDWTKLLWEQNMSEEKVFKLDSESDSWFPEMMELIEIKNPS